MCETFRNKRCPKLPMAPVSPALTSDPNSRREAGYRQPFEDLWEAGPAVLRALDSAGDRFPMQIDRRLRDWIDRVASDDPVAALDLAALDQAYRDLSTLHLSCYAYGLVPDGTARRRLVDRVVMTDRGYALVVGTAQECVSRIACALHGTTGARAILAAVWRERVLRRQIVQMMTSISDGAAGL